VAVVAVVAVGALAAGVAPGSAATKATTKKPVAPITVLVSNDDGVGAPGIDALVEEVRALPRTKVVVVAPAVNQTGAGGKVTEGAVVQGGPATTASGYAATAVQGTPADSVNYAFETMKLTPTVTLTGANIGQNLGPNVDLSGTIGAARASALHGVPALAVSAQISTPDYPLTTKLAADWLTEHRAALAKSAKAKKPVPPTEITSLNVPTCPDSKIRGLYRTTAAPAGTPDSVSTTINCTSTASTYPNDVAAFNDGWATQTPLPVTPGG
jgi:5'-nucleotidase